MKEKDIIFDPKLMGKAEFKTLLGILEDMIKEHQERTKRPP